MKKLYQLTIDVSGNYDYDYQVAGLFFRQQDAIAYRESIIDKYREWLRGIPENKDGDDDLRDEICKMLYDECELHIEDYVGDGADRYYANPTENALNVECDLLRDAMEILPPETTNWWVR